MSRRPLILSSLLLLATIASGCADAARATQPSTMGPDATPNRDVVDPATCRTGYNTSTGRCN